MIIFCIGLLYVRNECDWTRRQYFLVISFSNTSSCAIDVQSSILIANLRDISSRCTGCIYAVCAALRQIVFNIIIKFFLSRIESDKRGFISEELRRSIFSIDL